MLAEKLGCPEPELHSPGLAYFVFILAQEDAGRWLGHQVMPWHLASALTFTPN